MTPRTKQQVLAAFRCSEILDAARRVFSKRAYTDVTVDEIAQASGLAKATVYQYFPSKQEIYLAALRAGIAEMIHRTRAAMDASPDLRGQIEAFVRTRLVYLEANREFFAVYHSEFGNLTHPAALNREFRDLYREQLKFLEAAIRQAIRRKEIPPAAVDTAAITVYEATRGVMLGRMLGWSKASVTRDVSSLVGILWKGFASR